MEGSISLRSNRRGSHLVDRVLAQEAVAIALPLVEHAMREPRYGDSGFLHIVVMNPGLGPQDCELEQAILHEHSVGDPSKWDADYAMYARAKAAIAWRHREDSHKVQALRPHALATGETTLWGSVNLDGIVVGASGAFPAFDELYSTVVAACIRALVKHGAQDPARKAFLE
jgi:hypothetical protein